MRLLGAVLLGVLVAACGPAAPRSVPPLPPAASGAASSRQPASAGSALPSTPSSSAGHAAPDLEARLPSQVGGTALSKASGTGADVFQTDPWSSGMTAYLAGIGKSASDFRFAQAWDPARGLDLELGVFQVAGLDAAVLRQALVASSLAGSPGIAAQPSTVGGRQVTAVVYPGNTSTLYLYERDGVVFYVGTPDQALATEVLGALP